MLKLNLAIKMGRKYFEKHEKKSFLVTAMTQGSWLSTACCNSQASYHYNSCQCKMKLWPNTHLALKQKRYVGDISALMS